MSRSEPFIQHLEALVQRDDRAALAALRRGLGKPVGEAPEAYPFVVPWLRRDAPRWEEEAYYLVATLFAFHQRSWPPDARGSVASSLGASFARLAAATESGSVEKRFVGLLKCHSDDLPDHLRHATSLLRAHEVAVDWGQLLQDILGWGLLDRPVQRRWARAFWVGAPGATEGETNFNGQPSLAGAELA